MNKVGIKDYLENICIKLDDLYAILSEIAHYQLVLKNNVVDMHKELDDLERL